MHVIPLLLALVTTGPPVERWEPFGANPAWEVLGTEDASGVFRYSQRRRKTGPVVNYGVNLSGPAPSPGAPIVMGTDNETMRLLVPRASAGSTAPCAHSDCPNGRCDRLKPKPKPSKLPELPLPKLEVKPLHIVLVVGGLFGLFCVGLAFLAACVAAYFLVSYLFKGRSRP